MPSQPSAAVSTTILGDEQAGAVAHLEVEHGAPRAAPVSVDVEPQRLAGEELLARRRRPRRRAARP